MFNCDSNQGKTLLCLGTTCFTFEKISSRSLIIFLTGKFSFQDKLVVPRGAQMICDNISSTDKELIYYEGAFHNLYVELSDVKDDSIQRTLDFIMKRLHWTGKGRCRVNSNV